MKKLNILMSLLMVGFFANAQTTNWSLDKSHSKIGFTIDHMVITEVEGRFNDFELNVTSGESFEQSSIEVKIMTSSINTDNEKRDQHLQSKDFFNAEKFPTILFKSTEMTKISDNKFKLKGNITMHGITKEIELDVKYGGTIKDLWGNTKAGFKITGTLDRYNFDLKYNSTLEAGALMIGREVNLEAFIELKKD